MGSSWEPVEVEVDRSGEKLVFELIPTAMSPEQEAEMDQWITRSELAARSSRRACALKEFEEIVRAAKTRVTFRRPEEPEGTIGVSSDAILPPDLDLAYGDPLIGLIYGNLRAGDEAIVEYSFLNGILSEGLVEAPEYLHKLFAETFNGENGKGLKGREAEELLKQLRGE